MSKRSLGLLSSSSKISHVLLVAVMLAMLLLLGGQLWLNYRDQVKTAEISTHNMAAIFEARFDAVLRRNDADLIALTEEISKGGLSSTQFVKNARELKSSLERRMLNRDEMIGYRVHDARGDTLSATDYQKSRPVNIADRSYFQQLRDNPNAGLVVSEVLIGRASNKPILVFARAIRDVDGRFLGVVLAMLDLDYYRRQFTALDLGQQSIIALRRETHEMVLRYPDLQGQTNKALPADHPVVKGMASGKRTIVLHYAAAPDYVPLILSIVRMQDYPFYFAVGFSRDVVLAGWYQQVVVVVASALLLFLLVTVLLLRLRNAQLRQESMLVDLAVSEAQFRELAQLVPVGICYFDLKGNCTYVNDRCVAIAGRSRPDLLGRSWQMFVDPADHGNLPADWMNRVALGRPYVSEFRFVHPGGHLVHVLAEVQAGLDATGTLQGYLAALTDITLRKETEAELLVAKQYAESANLSKTRFLAAASHDLRQPIQAINLFLDALQRTQLSDEQETIASFLSRSVHALGSQLYSLLDVSKLDAGQVCPQLRVVEVEELFRAIDAEFSTLARQKNLRFKLFFPYEQLTLFTDPGLLMSVLRNLVDNALKYTEKGGVLVGTRHRCGKVVIQVWDTGIGIAPHYGKRIFEECFQVGDVVLDRSKGLGLGLAIAQRMATLLGCELSYASRLGQGSMFEVAIPSHGRYIGETLSRADSFPDAVLNDLDGGSFAGWTVVVIEDDPMVAKAVEMSLTEIGVTVLVFHSAEAALANPEMYSADFYISDFNLSGANGIELLESIRARRNIPIQAVLMTGGVFPARDVIESASSWPVLFKPLEMPDLLMAMKNAIDHEDNHEDNHQ